MTRLYVLKKVKGHDGKLVDNTKASWDYWQKKLTEEVAEVIEAINLKDKSKIMEETLDVFQVCIGMMYKLYKECVAADKGIQQHNKKLIGRGCEIAAVIRLHISKK